MDMRRWMVLLAAAGAGACSESTAPGSAARLSFDVEPMPVGAGSFFAPAVTVAVRDAEGALVTDWADEISLFLEGGEGVGALEGVTSRMSVTGLANFELGQLIICCASTFNFFDM